MLTQYLVTQAVFGSRVGQGGPWPVRIGFLVRLLIWLPCVGLVFVCRNIDAVFGHVGSIWLAELDLDGSRRLSVPCLPGGSLLGVVLC